MSGKRREVFSIDKLSIEGGGQEIMIYLKGELLAHAHTRPCESASEIDWTITDGHPISQGMTITEVEEAIQRIYSLVDGF